MKTKRGGKRTQKEKHLKKKKKNDANPIGPKTL